MKKKKYKNSIDKQQEKEYNLDYDLNMYPWLDKKKKKSTKVSKAAHNVKTTTMKEEKAINRIAMNLCGECTSKSKKGKCMDIDRMCKIAIFKCDKINEEDKKEFKNNPYSFEKVKKSQ